MTHTDGGPLFWAVVNYKSTIVIPDLGYLLSELFLKVISRNSVFYSFPVYSIGIPNPTVNLIKYTASILMGEGDGLGISDTYMLGKPALSILGKYYSFHNVEDKEIVKDCTGTMIQAVGVP